MTFKIGKIQGIDIKLDNSWFLIFIIITWSLATSYLPSQYPSKSDTFYWLIGGTSALTLYISILIHELAHSTVALQKGLGINSITLHFFGGVSEINEESSDPRIEAVIAFVGPLSSMIIGVSLLSLRYLFGEGLPDTVEAVIVYSSYVNFALALFNLIPAFPMDGGRVLRAFLWWRNGDLVKSTRTASRVAYFISRLFMGFGFLSLIGGNSFNGLWFIFIGFFIKSSSEAGLSQAIIKDALDGVYIRDMMTWDVRSVGPDVSVQMLIDDWFNVFKHQGYPVIQDGELVGIVTNEDVRGVDLDMRSSLSVKDIMKRKNELIFVSPDEEVSDAFLKMAKGNVGRLPVVEDGKLVGIVTRSDFNRIIQMKTQFNQ